MIMVKCKTKVHFLGMIKLVFFVCFLTLLPSLSIASTIRAVTFEELVQNAEFIFEGKVIAIESIIPPKGSLPLTCVLFKINEIFKGNYSDDTIGLCFLGGISGEYAVRVGNIKYPKLDEKGIYFVNSLARQYPNPLYGWKQGHFLIETDPHTSREHITTADRKPVTEITVWRRPSHALSTGVAYGVKTSERSQIRKAWTVEEFKQNLRSMLEALK